MKGKIASFVMFLFVSVSLSAQQITKFMGIPVDGFKQEMLQKLEAKGFVYDEPSGLYSGEFNGEEVYVNVQTNNNKVYRIILMDKHPRDATSIRIRYNNLCRQFTENNRYTTLSDTLQTIPDDEDIDYNIRVKGKQYEAIFYQKLSCANDSVAMKAFIEDKMNECLEKEYHINVDSLYNLPREEMLKIVKQVTLKCTSATIEEQLNRLVWFTIRFGFGEYRLVLFYENTLNKANGEDL